jgi:hypothetical protein
MSSPGPTRAPAGQTSRAPDEARLTLRQGRASRARRRHMLDFGIRAREENALVTV